MTSQEALPPPVSPGWICGHCGADNLHTTGQLTCRVCRYGKGRDSLPMRPKPAPQVVAECWTCDADKTLFHGLTAQQADRCRSLGHDVREVKP